MSNVKVKIKKEYYNIINELNDRQAGELIKGICAYAYDGKPFFTKDDYLKGVFMYIKRDIDTAKQNSLNGKKGAEALAERRRNEEGMLSSIGFILGSVVSKDKEEHE